MKRILVVDDNEDLLHGLKIYLHRSGYDVRVSLSCNEGLDIFYSFKPHLVLLDVNVGSSDGREMCRQIKAHADYRHVPVLLISANRDNLLSYEDHGANGAVEKPFDLTALMGQINTHLVKASYAGDETK